MKYTNKRVYNWRNLSPYLVHYLEEKTGRTLTGLKLVSPVGSPFWSWKLEGIRDKQLQSSPEDNRSMLLLLKPVLSHLWVPEEELLAIAKRVGEKDLVLIFKEKDLIFRKFTKEDLEEADKYRYVWEESHPGPLYNSKEGDRLTGPIMLFT